MTEQKTLKQEAEQYEPQTKTLNIADLDKVSVDVVVEDDSYEYEGEVIKIKVITVDGEKYRVPISVLNNLKVLLIDNDKIKFFKVRKTGEKLDTRYTCIPVFE